MANRSIDIRHFDVSSIAAPVRNPPTLTVANRISCSLAMVQLEQKLMSMMEKYNVGDG